MSYNLRPRPGLQVETLGPMDREDARKASVRRETEGPSNTKVLVLLLVFRWVNVGMVQTSFVPDEYWQSLEVAHKMVFGYGYLTWEWKEGIRGYAYPALFAALYKVLALLQLDYPLALILAARFLQATFSALGDFCLYKTSCLLHGRNVGLWTLIMNSASWFVFYNATRTLTNTMETNLTSMALYLFPWPKEWLHDKKQELRRNDRHYIMVVALACLIRPTAAVLWLPLCLWHVHFRTRETRTMIGVVDFPPLAIGITTIMLICRAIVLFLPVGLVVIPFSLLLDRAFYGHFVFVQKNFLDFNVLHDLGSFYGSHPWHWYISQGLPVILATHIPSLIMGVGMGWRKHSVLLFAVGWTLIVFSCTSHKEFRFIYPVVPICMLFCGLFMESMHRSGKSRLLIGYLLLNILPCVYFGLFHQRGVLDVMGYVRGLAEQHEAGQHRSVLFLMPCHSTPYYSFVHGELPMRFLECPPRLRQEEDYVEETSLFYSAPGSWLSKEYDDPSSLPTHLVFFDVLRPSIGDFLSRHQYHEVANYFHTHLPEGKTGRRVLVYAMKDDVIAPQDT